MNSFSYIEYKNIIDKLKNNFPILDFSEITIDTKKYCVIRHDVEFSVERAFNLAKIENSMGMNSTYCFQLRNNNYNVLSSKNIKTIKEMIKMGHHIGLHVYSNPTLDISDIYDCITFDCIILSDSFDTYVNRFSIHRPTKKILIKNIKPYKMINLNSELFFTYTDNPNDKNTIKILYLSDSNHQWKYGCPLDIDLLKYDKMQLNCHPFSWTEKGYDNKNNIMELLIEKRNLTINSIKEEYKTFPEELL
jgi:hypothetical protein